MKNILSEIKRVLVIRCGALGDLVYATSVIDALRLQYGKNIKIDFVTTPGPAKLFEFDPRVNKIFFLTHKKPPIWLSNEKKAIVKHAKSEPYDLLINLEQNPNFDKLCHKIEAKNKVGSPFTKLILEDKVNHMVDVIKAMFAPVVEKNYLDQSTPKIFSDPQSNIREKFNLKRPYIVLNPSNSHHSKTSINYRAWPQAYWKEFIEKFDQNIDLVIIGAKEEMDYFEPIKPYPQHVNDLVGKTSIAELISVIDGAQAILTTDTGPAHIASALNQKIFVLIGPTPMHLTGPYTHKESHVSVLSANLECSPCYGTDVIKHCKDNICMKEITVQSVLKSLDKIALTKKEH